MVFQRNLVVLTATTLLIVFYLVGTNTFFRHDDWLILGNAINFLPHDWGFLWDNRLYYSPTRLDTWFFRPFFKLSVWAGYQLFGLNHIAWILFQYTLFVATVFLGALCFKLLDNQPTRAVWFSILSLTSLSTYFANIVWIGEGMMNLPQLFLLALSFFLLLLNRKTTLFFSVICYVLSLGFKESAVFFPVFVTATAQSLRPQKYSKAAIWCLNGIMVLYLIWRLGFVPLNPGYRPHLNWNSTVRPIFFFLGLLLVPISVLFLNGYRISLKIREEKLTFILLLTFLGLLILPHLGHPFFSPGWLLLPGFFSMWGVIFLANKKCFHSLSFLKISLLCLSFSLAPIAWQAYQLNWFKWAKSQKLIHDYLRDYSGENTSMIEIETCPDTERPQVTFERVIGAADNLEHLWRIYHPNAMAFHLIPCSGVQSNAQIWWKFPEVMFPNEAKLIPK